MKSLSRIWFCLRHDMRWKVVGAEWWRECKEQLKLVVEWLVDSACLLIGCIIIPLFPLYVIGRAIWMAMAKPEKVDAYRERLKKGELE